jgi:excisionase family DNA binding protein
MKLDITRDGYDGYCGTSYVAKLLKLRVGTVQNLVESNSLKAWKTQGGHRRISLQSIQEYLLVNKLEAPAWHSENGRLRVFLIEDDENTRIMYQVHFDQWVLPTDVVMYASAMEALLDMPSMQPQLLLTDFNMLGMDGFKFLKTVREYKLFKSLPIVVMTGLWNERIKEKGGFLQALKFFKNPLI